MRQRPVQGCNSWKHKEEEVEEEEEEKEEDAVEKGKRQARCTKLLLGRPQGRSAKMTR